jgi:fatty-acyl-CoA synthase
MTTRLEQVALERSRNQTLGEILARHARRTPERIALVFEQDSLTYADLHERVSRLANALAERGVERGDRVAVLMHNRLEVVESLLACHLLGACAVPINFRLVAEELAYVLEDSDSVGVLTDHELLPLALSTAGRIATTSFVLATETDGADSYEHAIAKAPRTAPDVVVREDEIALLMYTSGTTGRPKGAMLTHRGLVANTVNWIIEIGATRDDVWLSGLPLFHIGGINGILPFLYLGATSVITTSLRFDPVEALQQLERHQATMCYFVPTQWDQICSVPDLGSFDTSPLRRGLWGASQAPLALLERLAATFPDVGLVNAFGQTEMSSNTCFLMPEDAIRKRGSVGRPLINVEYRVVDPDGKDVPRGEVGEIVYRGPTVMAGYHKNPEATAAAFRDGWMHSGDLVREDEDGYLYVVDRTKDMIISGGENIYPAEVERALAEHPNVREVSVFGVSHPRWVETPVAAVVVDGEAPSQDELVTFVQGRLASYKKPSAFVFVEELPRNASGKILKRTLRESYADLFED